jgi:signal peptidase II
MLCFMRRHLFIIGACVLTGFTLCDWLMKQYVITYLSTKDSIALFPFTNLVLHKNFGITFNIPIPLWIIIPVTSIIVLFLIQRAIATRASQPIIALGYVSIIVGAVNNLCDRVIHGWTTDYLMLFHTSIINGSDVLIFLGAAIILGSTHVHQRSSKNRE